MEENGIAVDTKSWQRMSRDLGEKSGSGNYDLRLRRTGLSISIPRRNYDDTG